MPSVPAASRTVREGSLLVGVFVLTIWLSCVAIGLIGWWIRYPRPLPAPAEMETMIVQRLEVELAPESAPPPSASASPVMDAVVPPPPDAVVQPNPPLPVAVAAPTPSIAFAVPVEGPVTLVEPAQATYATRPVEENSVPASVASASPPPQALTYGTGEGRQPAPIYPRTAIREGQEGSVLVRFIVAADGRVVSAEAHEPSPWPLLNEAALRAVRERWRFKAGPTRAYEVVIRFQLKK